ncbi:hypothetical protein [Ideonella livida]|uniref:Uncharacterized protein n=1 Tax=Ideonella livida TaxID=2707176 RepID=A0A7C9PKQ0_9BURK|nr:hypothetical protein [Ideonella livida]NDY93572.1 hypothetical protein [Ideonella livida]
MRQEPVPPPSGVPPRLLNLAFDAGSGICLWAPHAGPHDAGALGEAVDHHDLPLTANTQRLLDHLIAWHDLSLDWDAPPQPGPDWSTAEARRFAHTAHRALQRLGHELPAERYQVRADPAWLAWDAPPP